MLGLLLFGAAESRDSQSRVCDAELQQVCACNTVIRHSFIHFVFSFIRHIHT